MNAKEFLLTTVAVMIGTTIALAIAGLYVKSQITTATSGSSTISSLLSLVGIAPAAATTTTTTG